MNQIMKKKRERIKLIKLLRYILKESIELLKNKSILKLFVGCTYLFKGAFRPQFVRYIKSTYLTPVITNN